MANDDGADILERPKGHRENRKKNRRRKVGENQATATAKFVRVPPRKARLVMDEVRGRYAGEALAFLSFIPNRAAAFITKVLASAVANAANNHGLDPNRLKLVEARVDEGPRIKRVHPRAQGRAYRILKRMSHIMVVVEEVEPKPRKPRKSTRTRAAAARAARQPLDNAGTTTMPGRGSVGTEPTTSVEPVLTIPVAVEQTSLETAYTHDPASEIEAPVQTDAAEPTVATQQPATSDNEDPDAVDAGDKIEKTNAPINVDAEQKA